MASNKNALANTPLEVETLPNPVPTYSHFRVTSYLSDPKYTHYLFQFPSKFHAPIARWALESFVPVGGWVMDIFNGSGTIQVEALAGGYNSIGIDIDPVATYIAKAKTTPLKAITLEKALDKILNSIHRARRSKAEYSTRMFEDLSEGYFNRIRASLELPPIPIIDHWFRRYVLVDLARLRVAIVENVSSPIVRRFFLAVFAGIIRRSSNADPVPVSGLEYTKEMKKRDLNGRYIDPFSFFEDRSRREIAGIEALRRASRENSHTRAIVQQLDVLELSDRYPALRERLALPELVDVIISSPPYCSAVDYHTRHKLEAYWLGLVSNQKDYIEHYHKYIGRMRIRIENRDGLGPFGIDELDSLIAGLSEVHRDRAFSLHNYFQSMRASLLQAATVIKRGGRLVLFIGNSMTRGMRIDTHSFIRDMAQEHFELENEFSYEVRNRFMQYSRHNGADINTERVMIFKKPS